MKTKLSPKGKSSLILLLILVAMVGLLAINAVGVPNIGKRGETMWSVFNIKQGLDLKGGVSILYEADIAAPSSDDMSAAQALLRGRLDRRGYTEATAIQEGTGQIRVDIPGVEDAQEAIDGIGATARLSFVDADGTEFLSGEYVREAFRVMDPNSGPGVSITFNSEGASIFQQVTRDNLGRQIYIYMDSQLLSDPVIRNVINDGSGVISGSMTMDEAAELALSIQQGSLPFGLNVLSYNYIGARLGADALRTSIIAGAIGLALVIVFMLAIYRTLGICSSIALIIYSALVLFLTSALGITLSLPGIAGIILSVGMATDANVVIFERIREEIALGKSLRSAMNVGYRRALPAIVDSNVTTLIAGGVLFWLGTGPIMGFAHMLIIGILVSMFTCLFVTRTITFCLMDLGIVKQEHVLPKKYKESPEEVAQAITNPEPKLIVEKRKMYFAFSAAILLVSFAVMLFHSMGGRGVFNLDVEFSGGTSFEINIGQDFNNSDIEAIVRDVTGESAPQVQQILGTNAVMIRTTQVSTEARDEIISQISERYGLSTDDFTYANVSPAVSEAMRNSAILAIAVSTLLMLVYISVRFRNLRTGVSAVIAQMHDALVVLCVYGVLRIPLNYAFIAVMLTTLGYSINATIIVFDRIRENRGRMEKSPYSVLVNTSVTQTLRRTLFSTCTTFIAVFMLYIIGVATIRDFTLPIMVGLLFGAYSSVCLAGSVWYKMVKGKE